MSTARKKTNRARRGMTPKQRIKMLEWQLGTLQIKLDNVTAAGANALGHLVGLGEDLTMAQGAAVAAQYQSTRIPGYHPELDTAHSITRVRRGIHDAWHALYTVGVRPPPKDGAS